SMSHILLIVTETVKWIIYHFMFTSSVAGASVTVVTKHQCIAMYIILYLKQYLKSQPHTDLMSKS
uniref:Uncharacterized protein n=1 Tax=Amphimedon queenslandica TaxID=400682 RepID=A0A1X7UBJ6_AMPQE